VCLITATIIINTKAYYIMEQLHNASRGISPEGFNFKQEAEVAFDNFDWNALESALKLVRGASDEDKLEAMSEVLKEYAVPLKDRDGNSVRGFPMRTHTNADRYDEEGKPAQPTYSYAVVKTDSIMKAVANIITEQQDGAHAMNAALFTEPGSPEQFSLAVPDSIRGAINRLFARPLN
jgi:hypothetical protein